MQAKRTLENRSNINEEILKAKEDPGKEKVSTIRRNRMHSTW